VKRFSILAVILGTACIATASPPTVEELWSHLFTNGPVVWQAPTNNLPKSFWTYKKILPQVFSSSVISNAIVLASLQKKGFPQPSTNQIIIWEPSMENLSPNTDDPLAGSFSILPDQATISYSMPHFDLDSGKDIPSDEAIVKRARNSAVQLGLDPLKLMQKPLTFHVCSFDENGHDNTTAKSVAVEFIFRVKLTDFHFMETETTSRAVFGWNLAVTESQRLLSFLADTSAERSKSDRQPGTNCHLHQVSQDICDAQWGRSRLFCKTQNFGQCEKNSPSLKSRRIMVKELSEKCLQMMRQIYL